MDKLTIGRVARQAGVGVETVRFYERKGLVEQPRKPADSGFRLYSADAVRRIRFIRQAQQVGFSLREIQELLSLRADPSADCGAVREKAAAKVDAIDRKIGELEKVRAALQEVIAACPGRGGLRACTILEALEAVERPAPKRARSRSTAEANPMKSLTLTIDGMHCEGCAQTIEALVGSESGVQAADVSYRKREARILYDPERVAEEALVRAVERGGFRVAPRGG